MARPSLRSRLEQVIGLIRQGMIEGRWRDTLPGRERLARELGCSHGTMESALRQLAREGWLTSQGPGRRRRIHVPKAKLKPRVLRIRALAYDHADRNVSYLMRLMSKLREAGFAADFALKSQHDLGMRVQRVADFVRQTPADAWIVISGSAEIVEWFSGQTTPTFALFGRFLNYPIAGAAPRKTPAMADAVRKLVALGHRRIVMISNKERRQPQPALYEQNFLNELAAHGLPVGAYNMPDWEESAHGYQQLLCSLFLHTPPTAVFLGNRNLLTATQLFMARHGLSTPEKLSLILPDPEPNFDWCEPAISHFSWQPNQVIAPVMRWARAVAGGKSPTRKQLFDAEFLEGGTIGPAP